MGEILIFCAGLWIGAQFKNQILGFKSKIGAAVNAAATVFKK